MFYSSVRVYSAIPRAAWFSSLWSFISCYVMRSMAHSSEYEDVTASWIECLPCVRFMLGCIYSPATWLFLRFVVSFLWSMPCSWVCIEVLLLFLAFLFYVSLLFVIELLLSPFALIGCAIARIWLYSAHSAIKLALSFIRYATCVAAVNILRRYA